MRYSGPNQVIGTAHSFYEDTEKYSGKELVKAGVIDVVAAGAGIGGGALVGLAGAPVVMTIGGIVMVGVAVDWGSDKMKEIVIDKPKN